MNQSSGYYYNGYHREKNSRFSLFGFLLLTLIGCAPSTSESPNHFPSHAIESMGEFVANVDFKAIGDSLDARSRIDTIVSYGEKSISKHRDDPYYQSQLIYALGSIVSKLGGLDQAEALYRRAADQQLNHQLFVDDYTIDAFRELAEKFEHDNKYQKASELFSYALELRTQKFGAEDYRSLESLNEVAYTQVILDNQDQAQGIYEKVEMLAGQKKTALYRLQEASAKQGIAGIKFEEENYKNAEVLYRDVLRTRLRILGEGHTYTAHAMVGLANSLVAQKEFLEAEKLYLRALRIYSSAYTELNPASGGVYLRLGQLERKRQNFESAIKYIRDSINHYRGSLSSDHPWLHSAGVILTFTYIESGECNLAIRTFEEYQHTSEEDHSTQILLALEENLQACKN